MDAFREFNDRSLPDTPEHIWPSRTSPCSFDRDNRRNSLAPHRFERKGSDTALVWWHSPYSLGNKRWFSVWHALIRTCRRSIAFRALVRESSERIPSAGDTVEQSRLISASHVDVSCFTTRENRAQSTLSNRLRKTYERLTRAMSKARYWMLFSSGRNCLM